MIDVEIRDATTEELRVAFLWRLRYVVRLRREFAEKMNARGVRLLDDAIVTSYADCAAAGMEAEARAALETLK